jgi:hypothetical protein
MLYIVCTFLALFVALLFLYLVKRIDSGRLSELSTSVQNFAIALSAIIAGLWALYTFEALEARDNALIKTEEAQLQLQELKRQIAETSSSTIKLNTKVVDYDSPFNNNDKGLIVDVTITNKGTSKITYDLSAVPLVVYKVDASDDKVGYSKKLEPTLFSKVAELGQSDTQSTPLTKWISLANSERTLSYFVTIDSNSLYYIVFSSPSADENENEQIECTTIDKCNWFVSKYIFIEP